MSKPNCHEGCGAVEYRLVNGEVQLLLCEPAFEDALLDLVKSNENICFSNRGADKDGITTVEVN